MTQEQVNRVPDHCGPVSQSELIEGVGRFLLVQRPPTSTSESWPAWLRLAINTTAIIRRWPSPDAVIQTNVRGTGRGGNPKIDRWTNLNACM
jgi:hypothetical protein